MNTKNYLRVALALFTLAPLTVFAATNYVWQDSTNLSASMSFTLLAPNLPGQPDATRCTDTNATGFGPFFYRVGVKR